MGSKYSSYQSNRRPSTKELQRIHPIWRGVGFVMMVLIPVVSWAAADVLIKQNLSQGWFPMPLDLLMRPGEFLYSYFPDSLLYIRLLFFLVFAMVLFGLFMIISFLANNMFGVTYRNDPYYVPPIKKKVKKAR